MDNNEDIELLIALKKLAAENKSLDTRLEEYTAIISSRDNEIAMLQLMLAGANENKSNTDNQVKELEEVQFYINELKEQVAGSVYRATGKQQETAGDVSIAQQLEALKMDNAALQSQLTTLQIQLQEVSSRNLNLQHLSGRVAELESLLADIEDERTWKKKPDPFDENDLP